MEQVTITLGLNLRFQLISDGGEGVAVAVAAGRIAPAGVKAKTWTPLAFGVESRKAIGCTTLTWCTASRNFAL